MLKFELTWDPAIIILSVGIAFIGAYGGIILCEQFRLCSKENLPKLLSKDALMWLMAASLGGVAIWTMHFVGMSAMSLKDPYGRSVEVNYRIDLTLTSLAVVILLCFCGIYVSSRDKVYVSDNEDTVDAFIKDATNMTIQELRAMRHKNYVLFITLFKNMKGIVLGGIINAAGVCVMHYIGMEAMVIDHARMTWDVGIVAASVLIAIVAASAANWILFRLLALYPSIELLRIASAATAAVAVNGMHYTGMAAMRLEYMPNTMNAMKAPKGVQVVGQKTATTGAIIASMIFLWIIVLIVMADLRAWFYNSSQVIRNMDTLARNARNDPASSGELLKFIETYEQIRNHDFYSTRASGSNRMKVKNQVLLQPHSNGGVDSTGSGRGGGGRGGGEMSCTSNAGPYSIGAHMTLHRTTTIDRSDHFNPPSTNGIGGGDSLHSNQSFHTGGALVKNKPSAAPATEELSHKWGVIHATTTGGAGAGRGAGHGYHGGHEGNAAAVACCDSSTTCSSVAGTATPANRGSFLSSSYPTAGAAAPGCCGQQQATLLGPTAAGTMADLSLVEQGGLLLREQEDNRVAAAAVVQISVPQV